MEVKMKGKKLLTTFLAGALAITAVATSITPMKAVDPAVKLNIYKFFDVKSDPSVSGGDADITYGDGYWAQKGQAYKPLWTFKTTVGDKTGWAVVQPDYFRTEDGKVAYCIDPAKDNPSSVTPTDEQVSKKVYSIVKAGYPGVSEDTNTTGVSDIELEWATTWAVKAVSGGTESFDEIIRNEDGEPVLDKDGNEQKLYKMANDADAEKAEKIRKVAETLRDTAEVEDYDRYEVDSSAAAVKHEGGIYKVGPYKINQNIGANTTAKLTDAPANAAVIEEDGSYYVSIPEGSLTRNFTFTLSFTADKEMLASNVYAPADTEKEQRIFIFDMVPAAAEVKISVEPEIEKGGQIMIIKKDADGTTPLEGVEFEIYNTKNELAETITTNANGEATSRVLPYGSYTVKESKALSGYMLSKEVFNIVLNEKSAQNVSLATRTVTNKKNSVEITKIGTDSNKGIEGATLSVKDNTGKEIFSGKTDKDGKITMTGIASGKYTVSEKEAPEGYIKTEEVISFTMDEYGTVKGTTTLKNEPLKDVVIKKVDADNDKTVLKGAVIEIRDSANNVIAKETTDKNGEITLEKLAVGKYYYREIEAPKGYALNDKKYTFEVTAKGEIKGDLVIKDKIISVELKKTDTNDKVLEGATFTVKNDKKETVFVGRTNANGIVKIEKLAPGTYTFTETAPPAGYKINNKSYTFKVDEYGKVSGTTTIENDITTVTITKKDKADGKVLAGAKITIKDNSGKVVAEGKTGSDGKFVVEGLAPGTYVYTEDEAPEGYVKTNEKATFTINSKGEDLSLTLYNSKLNITSSTKKPSSTNKGTTTNSKGEIIKTGVDDTVRNMTPVYILIAAATIAGITVVVKRNVKKSE